MRHFVRLKAMRRLLEQRIIEKHFIGVINMRGLLFEATERALGDDLKRLERRIRKLVRKRIDVIGAVNAELSLKGTELVGVFDPRCADNRHHSGCLTPRGVEICYRLFDMGKSAMAVCAYHGVFVGRSTCPRETMAGAGWQQSRRQEPPGHPIGEEAPAL
ncbi:hypothetical protein [Sphingobium sp. RAC03]|uniref:hypothetical protein n=1 Tax=Sphingobium sp. RAC03 TaxID=1843368 RepID=UPI001F1AD0E2|nr:hypothetical protein [Sphingobium sp. RAC03]